MKPGSRAELDWSDDRPTPTMGFAEPTEPSPFEGVAAVLWVPDPEQRHGWREFYVKRKAESKPGRLGFRR